MKVIYIDATTEHNETVVKMLDSEKDAFELGCEALGEALHMIDGETVSSAERSALKKEGKWTYGYECAPSIEAAYDVTGSVFKTPVFTLQVWGDDVLERYNITFIEAGRDAQEVM